VSIPSTLIQTAKKKGKGTVIGPSKEGRTDKPRRVVLMVV
jgi:hypothetical protein